MMDFAEKIAALAQRVTKVLGHLETEEATKNALIMPFISALGYDVFDPTEVVPEFTADVGTKKGEKVDYAILRDGNVTVLFECKKASCNLRDAEYSQLYRYFGVTKARIAVLTNGVQYHFFTDLDEPNKMDARPFLEFDLLDPKDNVVAELRRLTKAGFNLEQMVAAAADLKNLREIRKVFSEQLDGPEEEFIAFFFKRANPGARFTASVKESFAFLVKRALQQFISDRVTDRLKSAIQHEGTIAAAGAPPSPTPGGPSEAEPAKDTVVTTVEELEACHIVKAIVRSEVDARRVAFRDGKSYMSVLLDDNNRRPICRLWFNSRQKYFSLFDAEKNEEKVPIESLDDIYAFSDRLRATAASYDAKG
jgi:hypothetical protein